MLQIFMLQIAITNMLKNDNQLLFVSSRPGKAAVSRPPGAIFREIALKLHTL